MTTTAIVAGIANIESLNPREDPGDDEPRVSRSPWLGALGRLATSLGAARAARIKSSIGVSGPAGLV